MTRTFNFPAFPSLCNLDVHIYHSATQGAGENSCARSPCSHLCLLAMNNTYSCDCPKYMELGNDQHTCKVTNKQKSLLLGIGNRMIRFEHQSFGRHDDGKGDTINFNIHKMAYNSITNDAIAVDNTEKVIFKFNLVSQSVKRLVTTNIGTVTALTFGKFGFSIAFCAADVYRLFAPNRSFGKQFVLDRFGTQYSRSIFI